MAYIVNQERASFIPQRPKKLYRDIPKPAIAIKSVTFSRFHSQFMIPFTTFTTFSIFALPSWFLYFTAETRCAQGGEPYGKQRRKNEELLNKQLQLLAEKSLNADADTLVSLTDVMCKVYKVLNGDLWNNHCSAFLANPAWFHTVHPDTSYESQPGFYPSNPDSDVQKGKRFNIGARKSF